MITKTLYSEGASEGYRAEIHVEKGIAVVYGYSPSNTQVFLSTPVSYISGIAEAIAENWISSIRMLNE
jgi:hypothetical protein